MVAKHIDVNSPEIDVDSVRWLRMRRSALDAAAVPAFRRDLRAVRDDLAERPGHRVGVAIGLTIAAIVVAAVAVTVGLLVMEVATGMITGVSAAPAGGAP